MDLTRGWNKEFRDVYVLKNNSYRFKIFAGEQGIVDDTQGNGALTIVRDVSVHVAKHKR